MVDDKSKYSDSDNEQIHFKDVDGNDIHTDTSTGLKEELEKDAEERGVSLSAIVRKYIIAGRRLSQIYDPREKEAEQKDDSSTDGQNPVRQRVPEGEENAISLDEFGTRLENDVIDIVEEDDNIKRDGWEIYK